MVIRLIEKEEKSLLRLLLRLLSVVSDAEFPSRGEEEVSEEDKKVLRRLLLVLEKKYPSVVSDVRSKGNVSGKG